MDNRLEAIQKCEQMAMRMMRHALEMAYTAGRASSHFGGGLSIIDIAATLYGAIMRYDTSNPEWEERDRFILSKGHGVLGYYAALAEAGFIPLEELKSFEKTGSDLVGHPVINRAKGIEFSNGSLGMGLSLGIGVALAGRRRDQQYRVFVLMGDGECNEGSVWEAAMAAPHYRLNNLIVILDRNRFQQTGTNEEIMSLGDLAAKWQSFGWDVTEVDGHDISELYDAFSRSLMNTKPRAIVAHTVKGKGVSFAENDNAWHHAVLTKAKFEEAMEELSKIEGVAVE